LNFSAQFVITLQYVKFVNKAEWEQWAVEDCDSDTGADNEATGNS